MSQPSRNRRMIGPTATRIRNPRDNVRERASRNLLSSFTLPILTRAVSRTFPRNNRTRRATFFLHEGVRFTHLGGSRD